MCTTQPNEVLQLLVFSSKASICDSIYHATEHSRPCLRAAGVLHLAMTANVKDRSVNGVEESAEYDYAMASVEK